MRGSHGGPSPLLGGWCTRISLVLHSDRLADYRERCHMPHCHFRLRLSEASPNFSDAKLVVTMSMEAKCANAGFYALIEDLQETSIRRRTIGDEYNLAAGTPVSQGDFY